ncbi:MAG: DUF2147 domain-containing protein [Bacteroidota bacterium]
MKKLLLITVTIISSLFTAFAQQNNDDIVGVWETGNGKARVKIDKVGDYYFGRIIWLKEPLNPEGKPKVDKNNKDVNKRNTPILGLRLVGGFKWESENRWEGGTIYDPETGNEYKCNITLVDKNTMNIRGYIGISMFGRTDTWKRIEQKK